jgi:hypothetical protein
MTKLSRIERETIILFNEAEATAEIETCNNAMRRRLESIRRKHPDEVTLVRYDKYGDTYTFPKAWVKVIPNRRATEKQKTHLQNARANRNL